MAPGRFAWALAVASMLAGAGAIAGIGAAFGAGPAGAADPLFTPPEYLEGVEGGAGGEAPGVYRRDCAFCHGSSGAGTPRGPQLRGVGRASVHYWLSTGRMPLRSPDEEIDRGPPAYPPGLLDALVDHVAGFGPGGPDTPELDLDEADRSRGLELYTRQCAACHTWSGVGGALLQREAPRVTASTARQIAEAVRVGPGAMPAFGPAALSDTELNDLVAYTVYLADPQDRGGNPLWHFGPLAEGLIAWLVGAGTLLLAVLWIGER